MSQYNNNVYFYHKEGSKFTSNFQCIQEQIKKNFHVVKDSHDANIIICFGGDGSFLQGVHQTGFREDCLYISVSATDKISFYNDFLFNDNSAHLLDTLEPEVLEVRKLPILEVTVDNHDKAYCLNEFSIQSSIVKTFVIDIYIDNLHLETFRGDGLIVSTPTGSTGYTKSVNGAIVDPTLRCMQIVELASINNNQFRTLRNPFILSADKELTLKIVREGNEFPIMAMDNEALSVQHVEQIKIKLSDRCIKTIKLDENSFWQKVKRTFL